MSAAAVRMAFRKGVSFKFTFQNWRHAAKAFADKFIRSPEIQSTFFAQSGHSDSTAALNYGREESNFLGRGLDVGIDRHYNNSLGWHRLLRVQTHAASQYGPRNSPPAKKQKMTNEESMLTSGTTIQLIIAPQTLQLPRGMIQNVFNKSQSLTINLQNSRESDLKKCQSRFHFSTV